MEQFAKMTFQGSYTNSYLPGRRRSGMHLIQASDGDLYGVTTRGGNYGQGVIFKIKEDGTGYTKLFEFDDVKGMEPKGGLIQLPNGYLCGITKTGGAEYSGNIYKIKLDGTDFSTIKSFTFLENNPFGNIILGTDGTCKE